jgi:RNA recognition motif-containing protein
VKTIYVGNLPLSATADEVGALFSPFGAVEKVTLMVKEPSGESRGFAFVEMADEEAFTAIDALDGVEFGENVLRINESRDRGAKAPRRAW